MHKEQAFILQLRGLEQKREAQQKLLGMEDYTFRQILEEVPAETASVLTPLFARLSDQIRLFQSINASAKDIMEVNLHVINSALAKKAMEKETHAAPGTKKDNRGGNHFTSRSV